MFQDLAGLATKTDRVSLDIEHLELLETLDPGNAVSEIIKLVEAYVQAEQVGEVLADRDQIGVLNLVVRQSEGNQTEVSRSQHLDLVDMVVSQAKFFQVVRQVLNFADVVV